MGNPSIQLYYDVLSPFGYIAYYTLRVSNHTNPAKRQAASVQKLTASVP